MALPLFPGHLRLERFGKSHGGNFRPEDARACMCSLTVLSLMGRGSIGNCALRSPTAISSIRLLPSPEETRYFTHVLRVRTLGIDASAKSQLPLWPQGP